MGMGFPKATPVAAGGYLLLPPGRPAGLPFPNMKPIEEILRQYAVEIVPQH
jgi:hypothetical protein